MDHYVVFGDSSHEDNPGLDRIGDLLDAVQDSADIEHGSIDIVHAGTGWGLSVGRGWILGISSNEADNSGRHVVGLGKPEILERVRLLLEGRLPDLLALAWEPGYAPPYCMGISTTPASTT